MISSHEFDRYVQVFEKLGSGSSSSVFSATWHAKQVALKCFTDADDDASNVRKEIEIMRAIDHPSIVKIYGACMSPLCLVLELVHGGSLHEVLHCSSAGRSMALDEHSAVSIATDIACAMTYLHELKPNKIIHRDLKPHNVLIEKDSFRAVLADFGVSRAVRTSLKTERIGAGTVNYMAPCLFTDGKADEKVDVYSFAMILYETCTGIIPWKGKHPMAIASLVTSGKRPELSSLLSLKTTRDISRLIEECWHGDPAMRPAFREITSRLETHRLHRIARSSTSKYASHRAEDAPVSRLARAASSIDPSRAHAHASPIAAKSNAPPRTASAAARAHRSRSSSPRAASSSSRPETSSSTSPNRVSSARTVVVRIGFSASNRAPRFNPPTCACAASATRMLGARVAASARASSGSTQTSARGAYLDANARRTSSFAIIAPRVVVAFGSPIARARRRCGGGARV